MRVEVLYFQGCPNHQPAVDRVRGILATEGVATEVVQVEVPNDEAAKALRFIGSPSVRVNGMDVEVLIGQGNAVGLCCRTYVQGSVREGIPSVGLIRFAIQNAKAASCT